MKIITITLSLLLNVLTCAFSDDSTVLNFYLEKSTNLAFRATDFFYKEDQAFIKTLDLNQDGKNEFLISSTNLRDGSIGLYSSLITQNNNNFKLIASNDGIYTNPLNENLLYIDEIGKYLWLHYFKSSGSEGGYIGYEFDGINLISHQLGNIEYDYENDTYKKEGIDFMAKYFLAGGGDGAMELAEQVRKEKGYKKEDVKTIPIDTIIISSDELAEKYGVDVLPMTYAEDLRSGFQLSEAYFKNKKATESPINPNLLAAITTQTTQPANQATQETKPQQITDEPTQKKTSNWLIYVLAALVLLVALIFFKLKKKK